MNFNVEVGYINTQRAYSMSHVLKCSSKKLTSTPGTLGVDFAYHIRTNVSVRRGII